MFQTDRQKMIDFIASQMPGGEELLILAPGLVGATALVTVEGDSLNIVPNYPDRVTVREVYDHVRWRAMPAWERRVWFRLTVTAAGKPSWDGGGGVLTLGRMAWRFRRQNGGPVVRLLGELNRLGWPRSVVLPGLDPTQVVDAAKVLRKTRPAIEWTAASDGHLSWRLTPT